MNVVLPITHAFLIQPEFQDGIPTVFCYSMRFQSLIA
jgi:hypothetical protein